MIKVTVFYKNNISEVKYFSGKLTARQYYENVVDFDYDNLLTISTEEL